MAYISQYTGSLINKNLQKSNFISDEGKVPSCINADKSITSNTTSFATTVTNADSVISCQTVINCTNATNATNCNTYLPLTGGSINGNLTVNKNYIRKNYLSETNHEGSNRDITISGPMSFTTINSNEGNAWNASNNRFICPVNGIYLAVFTIYSNNTGTTSVRPGILKNGSQYVFTDGPYGHSISAAIYCNAGDYLQAGAYNSNFAFTTWSGGGHNNFYVTLLHEI